MKNQHLTWIILLLLITFKVTRTVRVKAVKILSKHVQVGDDVDLVCVFELNNERIYSLKWYKEEREFFRVEGNRTALQFPVRGIQVDKSKSTVHRIRLKNVNESTSGTFICEVSVEGSFYTEDAEAILQVYAHNRNASSRNSCVLIFGPISLLLSLMLLHRYLPAEF